MKKFLFLAGHLLVSATTEYPARKQFDDFKSQFGRVYEDADEEARRFEIFTKNIVKMEKLNAINVAHGGDRVFGVTLAADLDDDEKTHMRGRAGHYDDRFRDYPVRDPTQKNSHLQNGEIPAFMDWRGVATTSVKNQGQCGSCWAFSVTEQIESEYMVQTGDAAQQFSPQQVASCVTECDGCGGGDTTTAYDYLMRTIGLGSDWFIPYVQGMTPSGLCEDAACTETCDFNLTQLVTDSFYIGPYAALSNFSYATDPKLCGEDTLHCDTMDEATLQANLANAPASICVNAGAWDSYTGGVLTSAACGDNGNLALDHCVQAVGYNTTADTPYWIVRNSWATVWGEEGYIYLAMGDNTCGLCNEATVVDLKTPLA